MKERLIMNSELAEKTGAPCDYEELYVKWRPYAFRMALRYLPDFPYEEKEDIADTLISEFCALGYLDRSEHAFTRFVYIDKETGEERLVSFSSFFWKYCRNRLAECQRRTYSSMSMARVGSVDEEETKSYVVDVATKPAFDKAAFMDSIVKIKISLDAIKLERNSKKSMSDLLLFLVKTINEKNNVTVHDVAEHYRITVRTAYSWLESLSCYKELLELV